MLDAKAIKKVCERRQKWEHLATAMKNDLFTQIVESTVKGDLDLTRVRIQERVLDIIAAEVNAKSWAPPKIQESDDGQ
jgi:hypothetical protein